MVKIAEKKYREAVKGEFKNRAFIHQFMYKGVKKSIDILFAIIGLFASISIIAAAAIFIKMETAGPIIYTQERVGKDGCVFLIYKLRTMYFDAEKDGIQWAQKNDPRVTKVGRFLRKTRIDELPQFINVLKGDMSIVGPRPERPYFIEEFNKAIPGFNERLAVKPGITGWSQINGGYELSPEEKLKNDLFYIKNQSILLDMKIILKTIKIIVTFEGAR